MDQTNQAGKLIKKTFGFGSTFNKVSKMIILNIIYCKCSIYGKKVNWKYVDSFLMLQDSSVTWLKQNLISNKKEYR